MQALNLPTYEFKYKAGEGGRMLIFDSIRKLYVPLTPEEWVRQHFVRFLSEEKKYPASLIAIELGLKYNQLKKRADILVYDTSGQPLLIVECKAPSVKITQDVFHQVAVYNMSFKVTYLVVTNGMDHYCCRMDYSSNSYQFLQMIPDFG